MKFHRLDQDLDIGTPLLMWRHRASDRFFYKIFSWLLGGFVFGILASIIVGWIFGLPDASLPIARIVFFGVFIIGVAKSFLLYIIHGVEYQITDTGLVHFKPPFGWDALDRLLQPILSPKVAFIQWEEVKEITELHGDMLFTFNDGRKDSKINIQHLLQHKVLDQNFVNSFTADQRSAKARPTKNPDKYGNSTSKLILQSAREARKRATLSK